MQEHLSATHKRILIALLPPGNEYRCAPGRSGILYHYRTCTDDLHGKNRATKPILEALTKLGALVKIGLPNHHTYKITEYGRSLVKQPYITPQIKLGGDIAPEVVAAVKEVLQHD